MGARILIIEDDSDLRENIKTLLEEEQFDPVVAKDGAEGIKLAKELKPNLIICDILMPGISGYDVLEALLADKKTALIPFIFLTAKIEKEDLRKGMELGADDYIFKPFQSESLLKAIQTRLWKNEAIRAEIVEVKENIDGEEIGKKKLELEDRIFLMTGNTPQFIKVKEIKFIIAERQYCNLSVEDGRTLVLRKPLSDWEDTLPEKNFLRIHRGTIINMNFVTKVEKWFNNSFRIYLKDIDDPFIISRRSASKLKTNV